MEKDLSIVERKIIAQTEGSENKKLPLTADDLLVFLNNLENFGLEGTNLLVKNLLGEGCDGNLEARQNLIHPEDFTKFLNHLTACKGLSAFEEKEIRLRIKSLQGKWEEYRFTSRLYKEGTVDSLLCIGRKMLPVPIAPSEDASNASDLRYYTLLDSLDEGFCCVEVILDLKGKPVDYLILQTNPAYETQLSTSNPTGKTILEINPEPTECLEAFKEVVRTGESKRFQVKTRQEKMWFNCYVFPFSGSNRTQLGLLFSNITESKMSEEKLKQINENLEEKVLQRTLELRENSDLLQTIFDTTNEGIVVFEPIYEQQKLIDFKYLRVNNVIIDQYQNEHLVGSSYLQVNQDAKEIGVFEKLEKTMLTGEFHDFEVLYDRQNFNNWFRITSRRQNGLLIVSMEDITKQKQEAQRLRENIRFKKHLTRASPDIIMIFNLYDEAIRYLNRDMASLPGMRKKDILGKELSEVIKFIHPSDREKAMDFHEKIIRAGDREVLEFEFRLRSSKGSYQWYNALGKVFMRNRKAKVYEYMILLRNIDQQIETQKALINAEKLSIKGEIARTLAHELRNPMASIGMATDILSKKLATQEEKKQYDNYLGIIKRSTKVLNNLVSELLTSSNYSPAVLKKTCLATILEDSLRQAKDRIYLSGIQVIKEYEGTYHIKADEEKLKIALLNIIVNASEAMEPNEGILKLRITRSTDDFTLTITDNGCGLEQEQLDKLFDAFYTHRPGGMGIGLNSVKNILEEHDAQIEVSSKPNKGTTFNLIFNCHDNF